MKSKIKLLFQLLFSLVFFTSTKTFGAACCGGAVAAPAVIVGDDRAQLSVSVGTSQVTDDVGTDSYWRKRNSFEMTETIRIEGAHIFQDRWQAGFSLPVIRRSRSDVDSSGLGDISGTLGYEYLTDWDYHPWRPRGLGFLQFTLPTGKSINESDNIFQLDSRGRGFWALGLGTILTKTFGKWDTFSSFDVHRSFNKNYKNSQSEGTLKPGFGGNFGIGGGYNLASLRFGANLNWTYEEPVNVEGTVTSEGSLQRYATASLSLAYLFQNEWTSTLTYSDQSLIGRPLNTSLSRGLTLLFQKRWLR